MSEKPRRPCRQHVIALMPLLLGLGGCAASGSAAGQPSPTPSDPKQDTAMVCRNLTKGNVIASRLDVADTFDTRRRGLLGRTSLQPGEGMRLIPCRSVHTMGMKFAIDIVFLDKDLRVAAVRPNVEPGCWAASCLKAHSTLELPAGTIAAKRIEVGDTLQVARPAAPEEKPAK